MISLILALLLQGMASVQMNAPFETWAYFTPEATHENVRLEITSDWRRVYELTIFNETTQDALAFKELQPDSQGRVRLNMRELSMAPGTFNYIGVSMETDEGGFLDRSIEIWVIP